MKKGNKGRQALSADVATPKVTERFSWLHFAYPVVGAFLIIAILSEWYKPYMENPWVRGSKFIIEARSEKDLAIRKQKLEQGGDILREQLRLHPYHARIWHFYAFYFYVGQQWDSCMYYERRALEKGRGGFNNTMEREGKTIYNLALTNKLNPYAKDHAKTMQLIEEAEIPGFVNPELDKFRGIGYMNIQRTDSSLEALYRYHKYNPRDYATLLYIAQNYLSKGNIDSTRKFAELARMQNDKDPELKELFIRINQ